MPAEQFANNAQTTLAAGVGAGDTSITVAGAAGFPAGPQFRLRVGSELMLVTGVAGTSWAVSRGQEGTAAAGHAAGAAVTQVLTAGFLNAVAGLTGGDQSANRVFAGPAAGGAAAPGFRALAGADLPAPTTTSPGGVRAVAPVAGSWVSSIDASGVPHLTQPAYTDVTGLADVAHTGSAADLTAGTLPAARLPAPTASTLGGVQAAAAVGHQWVNAISTAGVPSLTQPAFSDISGTVAATQLPTPTATTLGGVQAAPAVSHQWVNAIPATGVPSLSQPAFSDLSGTLAAGQMVALTGDLSGTAGSAGVTVTRINGAALGTTTAAAGRLLVGSGTQWVSAAVGGDAALDAVGVLTVTKTNGVAFAASATTDATDASNIAAGTLAAARLPPESTLLDRIGSTTGDVLYRAAGGWARLGIGAANQALTAGTVPGWTLIDYVSGLGQAEVSVTGAATAQLGAMHVCSGTAADYTVTLPTAAGNAGRMVGLRMAAGLTRFVTVAGASGQLINGSNTRVMWAGEACLLMSDGSNWAKVAGATIPMAASSYPAASAAVAASTYTLVALDTAEADNTGRMLDTTNKLIYVRRPGTYRVSGRVFIGGNSAINGGISGAARVLGTVQLNSTTGGTSERAHVESSAAAGAFPSVSPYREMTFAAGDYLCLIGWVGVAAYFAPGPHFSGLTVVEVPTW